MRVDESLSTAHEPAAFRKPRNPAFRACTEPRLHRCQNLALSKRRWQSPTVGSLGS